MLAVFFEVLSMMAIHEKWFKITFEKSRTLTRYFHLSSQKQLYAEEGRTLGRMLIFQDSQPLQVSPHHIKR